MGYSRCQECARRRARACAGAVVLPERLGRDSVGGLSSTSAPTQGGCAVSDHSSSSSVDVLDRALRDASTPAGTRRWLLERAAVGAAGVTAASAVIPAGDALAETHHHSGRHDSIREWGVFA